MASYVCGGCHADMELDLDDRILRCPCCGCECDISDDEIDEYDGDYYSNERISASDAALIWLSHGQDEDYMFGYSQDELENAL